MSNFVPLLVVAAALASPATLHAQTPLSTNRPPVYSANAFLGMRPVSVARAATIRPLAESSGARAFTTYGPTRGGEIQPRTAVDYSLARDGLHGSVGYICLSDIAPQAPHEAAVFAGSDEGRLVGASIKYPLR